MSFPTVALRQRSMADEVACGDGGLCLEGEGLSRCTRCGDERGDALLLPKRSASWASAAAAPVHAPVVAPSRPDEINMYLETDMAHTCSADWLAGGPSPRSARAAAQRAADARRSTIHSRPQKSDLQCDRLSAPTVRRPWRGVRHGSWDPSKWSREVDSVGGRGLESAVAAAQLLRKKK